MMTRALITGITGMVGSHLADYLLANTDWHITGMCRWRSPRDNVRHLEGNPRVSFVHGDLRDYISLVEVVEKTRPDYVFHLASQSYPTTSFTSPLDTFDTNILGTERLLEVLRRNDNLNPIIHVCSSSEVFGRVSRESLPIKEDCAFHPASPYAISKIGTDLIGKFHYEAYGQRVITTRMFTHTGPRRGEVFAESSFAKQIARIEAGKQEPVVKVGNLNSLRTWCDVRDAVRAYYLLVTVNPQPGEVYNIGGDFSCTVGEMLNTLLRMSSRHDIRVETEASRLRPLDADLQVPDSSKFRQHTGWAPQILFERTMLDLLHYWRERV